MCLDGGAVLVTPVLDGVCPLGCQNTLLESVEGPLASTPGSLSAGLFSCSPVLSQFILVPSVTPSQVQNLALELVK